MAKDERLNKFKQMFGIDIKTGKDIDAVDRFSVIKKIFDEKGEESFKNVKFSERITKLLKYWLTNCHDSVESFKNRTQLYQDMDMLFYNSPLIARAIKLIADEVVQADSNTQCIGVEAKRKTKDFILEFFDKINIYSQIRPTAIDIVQYGNAGWILSLDDKGVDDIIPIDVYSLKDRLEFTPYEVKQKMLNKNKFFMKYSSGVDRINTLIQSITNKDQYASEFKSYLFGFQIGEHVLPPWRFLHFRNITNKSPFKPFGIPVFIHSVAPYRQYDFAMTLQILARGARFPIDLYKLNLPNVVNPTDKIENAIEFLSQLMNAGIRDTKKEEMGIGEFMILINDLFDYDQKVADIDLGKVDDLEMLMDELMISTELPRYIIDPNDSGFGDSGVSLIQKWIPFARLVYGIQQIILDNLTQLVKIHMIQSNKFSLEEMEFQLTMPYPESQIDSDLISSQNDLLDLANDIIETLSDKVLDGDPLPDELLQDIYTQFLPYDAEKVNNWFKQIKSNKKETEENIEESWNKIKKNFKRQQLREVLHDTTFEKKQQKLREGVLKQRHYYSSKNKYSDYDTNLLMDYKKQRTALLESGKRILPFGSEEIKYNFKEAQEKNNKGE